MKDWLSRFHEMRKVVLFPVAIVEIVLYVKGSHFLKPTTHFTYSNYSYTYLVTSGILEKMTEEETSMFAVNFRRFKLKQVRKVWEVCH